MNCGRNLFRFVFTKFNRTGIGLVFAAMLHSHRRYDFVWVGLGSKQNINNTFREYSDFQDVYWQNITILGKPSIKLCLQLVQKKQLHEKKKLWSDVTSGWLFENVYMIFLKIFLFTWLIICNCVHRTLDSARIARSNIVA